MSKSSANRGIELQKSADLRNKKTPEEPSMHVGGKTAGMNPNATDKGAKKGRAGAKTSPFHDQLAEWRAQLEDSLQHAKTVEEKITAHAVFVANVQKKGFEAGLLRESKTKAEKQKDREVIPDAQAAKEFAVLDVKSFYLQKKEDQLKHDDEISKREIELRAAVGEALAKLNDDAVAAELALITKAEAIANLESAATNRRIFIARDQVKLQEAKLAVVAKYGSSQGEAIRKALQNAEQELQIAELEHKGALIRKQTAAEDALIQPMRARGEENADRLDLVQKQAQMERTDNGQQSQGGMAVEEQALRDQIANLGDVLAGPQNDAKSQADVFNKYLGLYQQLTALKMKEIDLDARGLVTQQYRYELALKDAEAQKASSDDYLLRLRMEESTVKNRTKEQKAEARAAADKASAEENAAKVAFEKAKESVKFAETRQGPELIPGQRAKTIGTAMDIARTREQEYNNKKAAGEAARRNASGPDGKTIQMAESSKAGNDENKLKIANSLRAVEAAIGAQRRESLALEIQLLSAQQSRLTTMGDYVGAAALQQQKMNKAVEQEKTLRDEMAREVDPAKKQALAVKVTEAAGASGREKVQAAISGDKAWNYGVGAFGGQTQGRVAALAELQDRKSKNQATVNNRDADLEKERDFRKNIEFTKGEAEKSAAKAKDPAEKAMYEAAIASFITQMEESRAKEQEINTTADVAAGDLVNTDALIEEVQRSLFAAPLKLAMDIQANYDSFSGEMGKAVGGAFEQAIATSNWDNLQTNMAESMNKAGKNFVAKTIGGMLQQGVENSFKKSGDFLVQSGKLLGNELIKAGKTTQGDLDKAAGGLSAAFDLGMMAFTAGSILSSMGNNSGGKGEQKIKEGEEVFDQTSEVRGVVMGETSVGVGKLAELFDPIAIKLGLAVDALIEVANLLKGGAGGAGAQVASAAAGAGIASTAPGGTQVVDINLKVNGTLTVVADIPKMQREIDEAIRQTVMKVVKEELHNKTKG